MDLKDVVKLLSNNELVLPNFQREFVWKVNSQKKLIASALCNIPSGNSLLVQGKKSSDLSFSNIKIGQRKVTLSEDDLPDNFQYILDGQQRYTTLYYAFNDAFNKTPEENKNTFEYLSEKLKYRWFLSLEKDLKFLMNYDNLKFIENENEKLIPNDILDFISYKKITEDDNYGSLEDGSQKLIDYCMKKNLIPLQLILSSDRIMINLQILRRIARNRIDKINKKGNKTLIKLLINEQVTSDEAKKIVNESFNKKEVQKFIEQKTDSASQKWVDTVYDYLLKKVEYYKINANHLIDINKAIATFEYINVEGTKLSTFDLLCAKSGIDLRKEVTIETKKELNFDNTDIKLYNNFGLLEEDDLISKNYSLYIHQTLNMIFFRENNPQGDYDKLTSKVLNSNYSISNLDIIFIQDNWRAAINAIKKASALLQIFCGHNEEKRITNKLLLIPIILFFLDKEDNYETNDLKCLKSFYWIKLFSGKYSKNQNQQCIDDCREIINFIKDDSKNDTINNWLEILNTRVLNLEEFATKEMMCTVKCNESLENNFFMYMISNSNQFYDWDFVKDTPITNESKLNIHHIIPLASAKKISDSTKELRSDKNHYLNATMNKTPITAESNSKIGAMTPDKYIQEIKPSILAGHYLSKDWFDKIKTEAEIKEFCERRFDGFKTDLLRELSTNLNDALL